MNFCIRFYFISFTNLCFLITFLLFDIGFTSSEVFTTTASAPTESLKTKEISVSPVEADSSNSKSQTKLNVADLKAEVSTRRPEKKELSSKTTTTEAPTPSSAMLYRLESENSGACILLQVDAVITFNYTKKNKERTDSEQYLPKDAKTSGDCSKADYATFVFKWNNGYVLIWDFSKTPGGERWFVDKVRLQYDTSDRHFQGIAKPEKETLTTPRIHGSLLFPTPVGQAYTCQRESSIKLTSRSTDTVAVLLLRELKVQPFIFKNEFGPEYMCQARGFGSYQSETVPLIVGSTLAAACLFTVTGYGIFRYFKIKKVQYDTME